MICMTLDCVIPTQSSVTQTIHCNVGLKCFFQLYQNVCYNNNNNNLTCNAPVCAKKDFSGAGGQN